MNALQVRPVGPSREGVAVLALSGELDYGTDQTLADATHQALNDGCRRLVLQCAGVTFCDSQGLNRFLRLRLEAQRRNVDLVLAEISAPVRHVLELTAALQLFTLADSVEDALRAGVAREPGAVGE